MTSTSSSETALPAPPTATRRRRITDFTATAIPQVIGSTGTRGFNTTAAGTIFFDPAGGVAGTTPLQ